MIEAHIKENPKFHKLSPHKIIFSLKVYLKLITSLENNLIYHCFENDLKFYMILGKCSIKPSFSFVTFCKRIGFFTIGIPY